MDMEPMNSSLDLLDHWKAWNADEPPFLLEADRPILMSDRSLPHLLQRGDWQSVHSADDFGAPDDSRVHLGLLPQPYCGDLRHASIYVLLLNPGIGNTDYYGEYQVPQYRAALLSTLRQDFEAKSIPFLFLDPQFAWHGGFGWWHGKLAKVIELLAKTWSVPFATARARLGSEISSIELFPYHSMSFRDRGGSLQKLPSVNLARAFVRDFVIPRVHDGNAIAIVMRQAKLWELPAHSGVVTYSSGQARGAHLSPDSPGGKAILKHLGQINRG